MGHKVVNTADHQKVCQMFHKGQTLRPAIGAEDLTHGSALLQRLNMGMGSRHFGKCIIKKGRIRKAIVCQRYPVYLLIDTGDILMDNRIHACHILPVRRPEEVTGTVTGVRYWPGKFLNAAWDKASTDNERCAWQMKDEKGTVWTFVQIAGLIARRIVPHAEQGDQLKRGQRFGMIRFGSRVDVYLPADYNPAVSIGDQVFAGQTVLAKKSDD